MERRAATYPSRVSLARAPLQPVPRLALSIADAAVALGISRDSVQREVQSGAIRAARIRGRVLIPTSELAAYLAAHIADEATW